MTDPMRHKLNKPWLKGHHREHRAVCKLIDPSKARLGGG